MNHSDLLLISIILICNIILYFWRRLRNNLRNKWWSCWGDNQSGLTFEIYKSNSIINSYLQADVTWSTGETTDSINVSPTSTTLYVVTVELDSLTYVDTVNVVVLETDTFFDNHMHAMNMNGMEIYTESGIYNYETTS